MFVVVNEVPDVDGLPESRNVIVTTAENIIVINL